MKNLIYKVPFQTEFLIYTENDSLINLLKLKYGSYINHFEDKTQNPVPNKITVKEASNEFTVEYNGTISKTKYPLEKIDEIVCDNTPFDSSVLALHGCAVEYNNKAFLFLGATTSGKTTLAAYLSGKGFGYITDDCILLDKTNLSIYPYTTPIHLREGGLAILNGCEMAPEKFALLDDGLNKRYVWTPENCILKPLPIVYIYFITRNTTKNQVIPMNFQQRMEYLMKSPIRNYDINSDYIRLISKLAGLNCGILQYKDLSYVTEVICNE